MQILRFRSRVRLLERIDGLDGVYVRQRPGIRALGTGRGGPISPGRTGLRQCLLPAPPTGGARNAGPPARHSSAASRHLFADRIVMPPPRAASAASAVAGLPPAGGDKLLRSVGEPSSRQGRIPIGTLYPLHLGQPCSRDERGAATGEDKFGPLLFAFVRGARKRRHRAAEHCEPPRHAPHWPLISLHTRSKNRYTAAKG